jgi:hypothetical protein
MVLQGSFDHVSDDDFARVTIAAAFVHAPHLDPSATSWLPFHFWILGLAMAIFGRSLDVARVASLAIASFAATLPYLALRLGPAQASRVRALTAVAFAVVSPWGLWLGASTVPESFTASFTAAAMVALGGVGKAKDEACEEWKIQLMQTAFAMVLLAACLSRYEPWPAAAVLACVLSMRHVRQWQQPKQHAFVLVIVLVAIGPLMWMAWNAYAHGSFVHFFHRVSNYKRAIGEGSTSALTALFFFPRLLITMRPDVVIASACAMFLLRCSEVRRVWATPLACASASILFLAYGNVRDGAPAHHPERALVGIVMVLALFAVDAIGQIFEKSTRQVTVVLSTVVAMVTLMWLANLRALWGHEIPGTSQQEDRHAQIAAGRQLRSEPGLHIAVTPCEFEHFALLAAFGAPERALVLPRSHKPVASDCPQIERR